MNMRAMAIWMLVCGVAASAGVAAETGTWTVRFIEPSSAALFAPAFSADAITVTSLGADPAARKDRPEYVSLLHGLEHPVSSVSFTYAQTGDASRMPISLLDAAGRERWRYDGRGDAPKRVTLDGHLIRGRLTFRVSRAEGAKVPAGWSHEISNLTYAKAEHEPARDDDGFIVLDDLDALRGCAGMSHMKVRKMNGIRIGQPARNTRLVGSRVHMRAMGHAIFVQGASDTLIEDCHVDGLLRPTDEILAETSGYAFDRGFKVPGYGEGVQIGPDRLIPPNEIVSLSEDGIRMYPRSGGVETGPTTIRNCTVANMRRGICTGLSAASDEVLNCEVRNCIAAGFNIGSGDKLVACRADAKYAEALCAPYLRSEGARVDLEILDSRQRTANNLLAKVNGNHHHIRLHTADPAYVPEDMTIELASSNGYGSFRKGERTANGVALTNTTPARVVLSPGAVDNTIISRGPVTGPGEANNVIRRPPE